VRSPKIRVVGVRSPKMGVVVSDSEARPSNRTYILTIISFKAKSQNNHNAEVEII